MEGREGRPFAVSDAAKQFNVSTDTISRWIKEVNQLQSGVWISEAEHNTLIDAYYQLKKAEKSIDNAKKELKKYIMLNYMTIKTRKELLGESCEEAFKMALKSVLNDEENEVESTVNQFLTNSMKELHTVSITLEHFKAIKS